MLYKIVIFLLFPSYVFCQVPAYYGTIDFTQDSENVKLQLAELISDTHTYNLIYTPDVWNVLKTADLDPVNSENVLLIYGYENGVDNINSNDRSRDKNSSCHTSSCNGLWVREHTFPRSLGNPNLGYELAGSDAHHLRAIDSQMNNSRSNRVYDNGSGNASVLSNGNFYPGDEWKGDVARMMMYMYLRYGSQCLPVTVGAGTTSNSSLNDFPDIFLQWNIEDPVSDFEINRNNVIALYQGNRNPFIDNPYLATIIWNGNLAEDTWNLLNKKTDIFEDLVVYPTITTDYLYVKNLTLNQVEIRVYDLSGKLLKEEINSNQIDVSMLEKGMYILSFSSENQFLNKKIIKK